jgi:hypothetical protein
MWRLSTAKGAAFSIWPFVRIRLFSSVCWTVIIEVFTTFNSEQRLLDLGDEGRSTYTFKLGLLRYYFKLV